MIRSKAIIDRQRLQLVDGSSLSEEEAAAVMEEIMGGEATPAQFGAFVTALRLKGETVDEITGMARVMREKALRVSVAGPLLDTCGTGGDARARSTSRPPPPSSRRRRAAGRQARQPRHDQRLRQRRRPGGAGRRRST